MFSFKMLNYRLLIFLMYVAVVNSENVLFVQKTVNGFNLTCIGGHNSTLTWIGNNYNSLDYPNTDESFTGSDVKIRHSYNFNLPPALDRRWKDFRKESCKCGKEQLMISNLNEVRVLIISLRFKDFIKLQLNKANNVILYENTTSTIFSKNSENTNGNCQTLDLDVPWRHYSLYLSEGQFYISKTVEVYVEKFKLESLKIVAAGSNVEFKIQNYKVVSSDKFNIQAKGPMCWSVFYFTRAKSKGTININNEKIPTGGLNFWKERTFHGENLWLSSVFPIITDVRKCKFGRTDLINTNNKVPLGCQDIANEVNIAVSKPTPNPVSNSLCNNNEFCKKRLVCKQNGCFCLQKYGGDYCEEDKSMAIQQLSCEGRWGPSCEYPCGENCKNAYCEKSTGTCLYGCKPKFYGDYCSLECPRNCKHDICEFTSGACSNGCLPNFEGRQCKECIQNKWGSKCDQECGIGCKTKRCVMEDGSCPNGCNNGYYGKFCEKKCGRGCLNTCDLNGNCKCRSGYDQESKCEFYRYLHDLPKITKIGPNSIYLEINTSELDENTKIKVFNKDNECSVASTANYYNISNLNPGEYYELEIVVCSKSSCEVGNNQNRKIRFSTCLDLDTSLISIKAFPKSIKIQYAKQGTFCESYRLHYTSKNKKSSLEFNTSTEIKHLTPFTDYEIKITNNEEQVYKTEKTTGEALPSEPTNLKWNDDELFIEWTKPLYPNGVIQKYYVFINNTQIEVPIAEGQTVFQQKLNVSDAAIYKVNVQAVNSHEGEKAQIIVITKPPKPKIAIRLADNCEVCNFDVIIEDKLNSTIYEVQDSDKGCNGDIIQKKEFHEKNIISLTDVSKDSIICVENNFWGKTSVSMIPVFSYAHAEMRQAQFPYYIIPLMLLIVIIGVLIFGIHRYRNKSNSRTYVVSPTNDIEAATELIPKNEILSEFAIPRSQVQEYLKNLICREIGATLLDDEFSNIESGTKEEMNIGELELNSCKNRYKDALPYNTTRVILKNQQEDYINASYVQGYNGDKTYIATQCPKSITQNDFWSMIHQEKVEIIVMLSTLSEGSGKMTRYWPPDNSSQEYRSIEVTHIETVHRTDFVARKYVITFKGNERKVTQISYTTWPDNKNPLFPLSLIDFLKYVQIIRGNNTAPIVVHCSAGLGRTGSFIMCDHYFNTNDEIINVPSKLTALRTCRSSLVQTHMQYRLIYFILNEITSPDAAKNISLEVIKTLDKTTVEGLVHNDMTYIQERLHLNKLLYTNTKLLEEHQKANRNPRIGAVSESAIFLPELKNDKNSSYINAVHVHGYEEEYKYISTQIPLKNTVREFWRMIYQTSNKIIIVLQDTSDCQFWPSSSDYPLKPDHTLEIYCDYEYDKKFYKVYDLEVTYVQSNVKQKVTLFAFRAWSTESLVPNSVESFYTLYKDVFAHKEANSKIALCCFDSAIGCGLFIAFDLLINKIKTDNIFNVCWAIRSIKRFRNDFISSNEQLFFLYELAKYYINNQISSPTTEPDYENLFNLIKEMESF